MYPLTLKRLPGKHLWHIGAQSRPPCGPDELPTCGDYLPLIRRPPLRGQLYPGLPSTQDDEFAVPSSDYRLGNIVQTRAIVGNVVVKIRNHRRLAFIPRDFTLAKWLARRPRGNLAAQLGNQDLPPR